MNRFLIISFLFCYSLIAYSQDVIVKKDGSTILSKVLEVNTSDIKYKKFKNPDGPTYTILKSELISINYENGEKDIFEDTKDSKETSASQKNTSDPKLVERQPSENNSILIEAYDRRYNIGAGYHPTNKSVNSGLTTWGVAPSSVISNEDIEIEFEERSEEGENKFLQYAIIIKNRTNKTLYVDRGNSYRVTRDENYCYYNSGTQVSTSHGSGVGITSNLGGLASAVGIGGVLGTIANGINVGGGVSNSSGMTVGQQRFLLLPPHGRAALAQENYIKGQKLERNERYAFSMKAINPPIHKGEVLNYNENDTPYTVDYLITYSDNQNFATYSVLNTRLYMKQIFGTHISGWSIGNTFEAAIKRRISDIDKNCIIGILGESQLVQYIERK